MARVVCSGPALDAGASLALYNLAQGKRALAIGPGLGMDDGTWRAIAQLIAGDIPKVVDADALNLLARHGGKVGANTVLTPHPGEMERLTGAQHAAVTSPLPERSAACAARHAAPAMPSLPATSST